MRKISSFNNEELRDKQYNVLVDVVFGTKNRKDLWLFLESFLTQSERAYLGQRLNIIRMLSKDKSYQEVKEELSPSTTAISNAQKCIDKGKELIKMVALEYKHKPKTSVSDSAHQFGFFRAHKPGSPSHQFKSHKR